LKEVEQPEEGGFRLWSLTPLTPREDQQNEQQAGGESFGDGFHAKWRSDEVSTFRSEVQQRPATVSKPIKIFVCMRWFRGEVATLIAPAARVNFQAMPPSRGVTVRES